MTDYLYHGTSARLLDQIRRKGLQPRSVSKHKGNWAHTVPSNPKAVYLTDTYPFHFAAAGTKKEPGLILEIDREKLLPWKLCPDEDALEQSTRSKQLEHGPPIEWSMKERTKAYRKLAPYNPKLADVSLKVMGTAGYYGIIPWDAVTRYVEIDWKLMNMGIYMMCVDTMVSVLNYKILHERHKALVRWLFNDPVKPEDMLGFCMLTADGELGKLERQRFEAMREAMANRQALKITVLKPRVDPFDAGKYSTAHLERSQEV